MRVLHVTPDYVPDLIGGIGSHVHDLHHALRGLGIDSGVITTRETSISDGRVWNVPSLGPRLNVGTGPLSSTLLELQRSAGVGVVDLNTFVPDLVHAHDYRAIIGAEAIAQRFGIPLVITKHSVHPFMRNPHPDDPLRKLFFDYVHQIQSEGFARASRLILLYEDGYANVEPYRDELNAFRKVRVIANGVSANSARSPEFTEVGGRYRIVCVGRLEWSKGQDLLIEAIEQLPARLQEQVSITFIGRGQKEQSLRDQAAQSTSKGVIHFLGQLPRLEVPQVLARGDLFVLPSRHEVFPLSTLEAMACSVPVVAPRTGGVPQQLGSNGNRGLLFEPGDSRSLAKAIEYAADNPSSMQDMSERAFRYVVVNHSWERVAKETLAVYRDILE